MTHRSHGGEDTILAQRLIRHWGVYALTGYSKWGLMLFVFRSARELKQALDEEATREVRT